MYGFKFVYTYQNPKRKYPLKPLHHIINPQLIFLILYFEKVKYSSKKLLHFGRIISNKNIYIESLCMLKSKFEKALKRIKSLKFNCI